jgi:hypothetical protein
MQYSIRSMGVLLLAVILTMVKPTTITAQSITDKAIGKINAGAEQLNNQLDKTTLKFLKKIERQEAKLKRKLFKKDSVAAKALFSNTEEYSKLKNGLTNADNVVDVHKIKGYYSKIDSMTTGLNFLKDNPLLNTIKNKEKLTSSIDQYKVLQNKLEQTTAITNYLKQRQNLLKSTLDKFNMTKYLNKYTARCYGFSSEINAYKNALKDPRKAEALVLSALNKIPKFKEFFAKYSQLGQLFPMPQAGVNNNAALAGLQTRAQVMQQIQNTIGTATAGGTNPMQVLQQNMQTAQNELQKLKDKAQKNIGGGDADFAMPNSKAPNNNSQKSKSFFKRLEFTTNIQTSKGVGVLPNIADLAVGVGYKFSDKQVAGVQVAGKVGLGTGLSNIKFSLEGINYRSYADMQFKGNFWLTGGYELSNFTNIPTQQPSSTSPLAPLQRRWGLGTGWSRSALLGLSKKYSITKKRKGEAKLLYNFLWQEQPNAQKIIFRTGLNF